ncbi:Protein DBF4 A [Merluccius polli]|uniref:Protein DBF4 homolog A n=1 Tax=Merluccius polli TaxID=89951 RepID=A0AA47MX79_MERPO|nr:Protein DBF4 A [Merluccius polli]
MPGQQQVCPNPLAGKLFYLDLPSNRKAEALENDIKLLGGTIEKFFSKEIRYLVSNKREAKYVERLRRELATPSPDSGQSSPFPHRTGHQPAGKSGSQGQADSVVASRGKSLVERVVKEQERIQIDKTLSNALEWGVKVLYIDGMLRWKSYIYTEYYYTGSKLFIYLDNVTYVVTYVEKKKKQIVPNQPVTSAPVKKRTKPESKPRPGFPKSQAVHISTPFIKVEDSSRHYRPIYAAMSKMPEINMATAAPCTPFCLDEKDQKKNGHSEERGHGRAKKNGEKKQVGFCECCMLQYDNLIKSESHLAFSKGKEYLVLDRLVSTMRCDFALFKNKTKRLKCSVSSTLAIPGPYRTKLHKPQDTSVTEKRRKPYSISTASGGREPSNGLAMEPIPGSVKTSGAKSILRNLDPTSAQPLPNHTSHTCRIDSVSDQTPTLQVEVAPSRGHSSALYSARLSRLSRTRTWYHKEDSQSGCSSRTTYSLQNEVYDSIRDSPSECQQNALVSQEKKTHIPECQGVNLHARSPSPVRTIQRKVKVQKRKRRKVDTGLAGHNQVRSEGDQVPDDGSLCLWQL